MAIDEKEYRDRLIEKKKDAKKYYEKTKLNKPSPLLSRIFINKYNEKISGNKAIDLGCGAGNDTIFLLDKGFEVTAIDSQPQVKEIIEERANTKDNLDIIIGDFSKIQLQKADLINANMSLFFVKENFNIFIENMLKCVNTNGIFVGNFLGKEDDWSNIRTTVEKKELLGFFKDFDILYYSEEKYFKDTALGENKFWHVYSVIAQKIYDFKDTYQM